MSTAVSRRSPPSFQQVTSQLGAEKAKSAQLQREIKQIKSEYFTPESTFAIALLSIAGAATAGYLMGSPTALPAIQEFVGTTVPEYFRSIFSPLYNYNNP